MMAEVVTSFDDALADLLGVIQGAREQVQAELVEAEGRVKHLKSELQRIDRVVKAAEPPAQRPAQSARQAPRVSGERKDEIVEVLRANPEGMTAGQIAEKMGVLKSSTVSYALNALRDEERVRLAGVAEVNGHGRAPKLWKAFDA